MDNFLEELAIRKYNYHHYLHVFKPHACTHVECLERLENKIRQDELLAIIDQLPIEQQKIIDKRVEELKS